MSGARCARRRLEQLPTDALGSPAWVAPRHLANERDPPRRWSTGSPRAPSPERAESCAMPADNGRGLDEQACFPPSGRESRGENNRQSLPACPTYAAGKLPLRGDELLSKKRILRNQFTATANEIRGQPDNEPKKVDHLASLTPVYARMEFVARTGVQRGFRARLEPAGASWPVVRAESAARLTVARCSRLRAPFERASSMASP